MIENSFCFHSETEEENFSFHKITKAAAERDFEHFETCLNRTKHSNMSIINEFRQPKVRAPFPEHTRKLSLQIGKSVSNSQSTVTQKRNLERRFSQHSCGNLINSVFFHMTDHQLQNGEMDIDQVDEITRLTFSEFSSNENLSADMIHISFL